jgi:hypothetical protein
MAFNTTSLTAVGTKGSDVYTATGVEDPRVALSVLLVRNAYLTTIRSGVEAILAMENRVEAISDLVVMAFQTRDVRGGKGERTVAFEIVKALLETPTYAPLMSSLLDLVPEYGSWRDLFVLAETHATRRILDITVDQMKKDQASKEASGTVSLMAKYAPREDKHPRQFKALANRLYPDEPKYSRRCKMLRQTLSALNKAANTVEIKMCEKHFADIKPGEVPGRALQTYTKAFLNQPSTYTHPLHSRPSADKDRILCAEQFTEHFAKAAKGEAKLNGSKTVFPHELIKKLVHSSVGRNYYRSYEAEGEERMTQEEKDAIVGVWTQMVKDAKEGGGLGRSLAMCDFSGSMQSSGTNHDTPYWVSMAMGLLISEVTTEEFADTFLTFDSQPIVHTLPKGDIFERVASISPHLGQGTSTDFQKAMDLVLQRCKEMRVKPGEEPENLIVLTDMNWDQACSSSQQSSYTGNSYRHVVKTDEWQTHVESIRESFKRAGEDMWGSGQGLTMPRIVIWNIAATSADFHAKADTEGVVMLSGWSPSLFKVLQKEGVVIQTPYQALRCQLDDERYAPVRQRVEAWLKAWTM